MFADDTKCAISINHSSVGNPLQSDLFSLSIPGAQLWIYYLMNLSLSICVFGQNVLIDLAATI